MINKCDVESSMEHRSKRFSSFCGFLRRKLILLLYIIPLYFAFRPAVSNQRDIMARNLLAIDERGGLTGNQIGGFVAGFTVWFFFFVVLVVSFTSNKKYNFPCRSLKGQGGEEKSYHFHPHTHMYI